MRIISGKYKGKKLIGYNIDGTRPTQDRVKESLFAMIQEYLVDAVVLDLFAGSGNLGIEAISNGANVTYFVDNNNACIKAINKNLEELGNCNYEVLNLNYYEALTNFKKKKVLFDIVFLDPPYKLNCLTEILNILNDDIVKKDGIIICEYELDNFNIKYDNLEIVKEKKYGYKNIRIYKKRGIK